MQLIALIVIRVLGTLCGLCGVLLISWVLVLASYLLTRSAPFDQWDGFLLVVPLGLSALGLHVYWIVWWRLSPMTVRRLSFVVGLVVWIWIYSKGERSGPPSRSDFHLSLWQVLWLDLGQLLLWPIAAAVIVGCAFSHIFRRALPRCDTTERD